MTESAEQVSKPLKVTLKPRKSRPFFARHPWVFSDSIAKIEGDSKNTDEVALYSQEGAFIARGLINSSSKLRIRLYRWDDAPLDKAFWAHQLDQAIALRHAVPAVDPEENARRLVFSEADGLSGLIIDQLGNQLVCQWTSIALHHRIDLFESLLKERFPDSGIIGLGDPSTADIEGFSPDQAEPTVRSGALTADDVVLIRHGGLNFHVSPLGGQKTGFFLDQGVNRRRVATYANGRSVLDLFCYSGGFGLAAAKFGHAKTVVGIDSSKPAIALAEKNREANGLSADQVTFQPSDVAKALKKLIEANTQYGLVVCDPPKYARSRDNLNDALKAYRHLNENAMRVTEPGGFLASFTCSGAVEPAIFDEVLTRAAEHAGRTLQIVERLSQSPDHPVAASCPEGRYLYGVIARVL
jgi:23S rRNA (cytosine1962-C5)-methyltransferase